MLAMNEATADLLAGYVPSFTCTQNDKYGAPSEAQS